jgi:hypothetical protein
MWLIGHHGPVALIARIRGRRLRSVAKCRSGADNSGKRYVTVTLTTQGPRPLGVEGEGWELSARVLRLVTILHTA